MKEKIAKLIDLKSIITILMTVGLMYGWAVGKVSSEQFLYLATMVFMFYFQKDSKNGGQNNG